MKQILIAGALASLLTACQVVLPKGEDVTPSQDAVIKSTEAVVKSAEVEKEGTSALWVQFENAQRSGGESELPDFSFVGYQWGEKAIPTVEWELFDVTDFGAVPNDGKSDKAALIRAIAAAEANGSGIIFFPEGRFLINEQTDSYNEPIKIKSSRIVLRGSGSGPKGTELFMDRHMDATDPDKFWTTPYLLQFIGGRTSGTAVAVVADARRGAHTVELADTSGFRLGDWVVLSVLDNSPEAVAVAVAPYAPDPLWTSIIKKGVKLDEEHCIEAIEGKHVTFREPVHAQIQASQSWKVSTFNPLEEIGVEGIRFVGNWQEKFVHHKNAVHDGGWSMLLFSRCVNSWVRDCRFVDFNCVQSIFASSAVTVEDVTIEGNRGHSAISLNQSSHCLIRRVIDTAGQWHAIGVSHASTGNVFLRCTYPENTCYESHAAQPRWNLFDNISGGWMMGRWGGAKHNQPNHLEGLVLWNYNNIGPGVPGKFPFMRKDSDYGRTIMPYVIGFHGNAQDWVEEEIKVLESNGASVYPESLYEAQLELRRKDQRL